MAAILDEVMVLSVSDMFLNGDHTRTIFGMMFLNHRIICKHEIIFWQNIPNLQNW